MWRMLPAVALGVAGALYVASHRSPTPTPDPDDPGWMRLPNGLRVIVRPIEGATQVAILTQFDVGSDHDPDGRSGLAHLAEHLYVTSAAGSAPAQTVDEWEAKYPGGECTAETRATVTIHLVKVPPSSLEAEIADAAARMSDLRIEASDLDRERPRVLQQIAAFETAWPGSKPGPAGWIAAVRRLRPLDGGGVRAEVEAISLDEARAFARRVYSPANARLVLTGAVDASGMRLVAKHFAELRGGERPPPVTQRAAMAAGGRVDVDCGSGEPGTAIERAVWIAYPGPSRDDPDSVAVLLLERRTRAPDSEPRRFQAMSVLAEGVVLLHWAGGDVPVDDVVTAADELVARFVAAPPTDEEIDWIAPDRDVTRSPFVAMAKFPEMLAVTLADQACRHADPDRVRRSLRSLTKDDLARFAAKWLDPRSRVVAVARGPVSPPVDDDKLPPFLQEVKKEIFKDVDLSEPPAGRNAPSPVPRAETLAEVRVALTWDEATQTVHRKIGDVEYPKDDELEKAIRSAQGVWAKNGKPDAPVTIDCDVRVPRSYVIAVVNVVKRCGIDKIEFANGAPPKKAEDGR